VRAQPWPRGAGMTGGGGQVRHVASRQGMGWHEGMCAGAVRGQINTCLRREQKKVHSPTFPSRQHPTQDAPPRPCQLGHPTPFTMPQLCGPMGPSLPHYDLYTTIGERRERKKIRLLYCNSPRLPVARPALHAMQPARRGHYAQPVGVAVFAGTRVPEAPRFPCVKERKKEKTWRRRRAARSPPNLALFSPSLHTQQPSPPRPPPPLSPGPPSGPIGRQRRRGQNARASPPTCGR
jgi:hypothetical protein